MLKIQMQQQPEKSYWLVGEAVCIGAAADNDIVLRGQGIAAQHLRIEIGLHDQLTLFPVQGAVHVNHLPVSEGYQAVPGDVLSIGAQTLVVLDPKREAENYQRALQQTLASEWAGQIWQLRPLHPKLADRRYTVEGQAVIGRGEDCDITIPYKRLSRQHLRLQVIDNQLYITDLDSANGSWLNDKRIHHAVATDGDILSLAKLQFAVIGPDSMLLEAADKQPLDSTG